MRFFVLSASAAIALAAAPAFAQLAGSGNLLTTNSQPQKGPSSPHQSATLAAAGGGTRGAIASVNGGDLAPSIAQSSIIPAPKSVGSNTPSRSAGAYVMAYGPGSGPGSAGARVGLANGLGQGPANTYRDVNVNAPTQSLPTLSAPGTGSLPVSVPKVNLPTH